MGWLSRRCAFEQRKVNLVSRNSKSFNEKFYPVSKALQKWNINAVVDGEVVVLNERGVAHFGSLQNWRSEADGHLVFYVFDLLWLEGFDLTELPLERRRELLRDNLPKEDIIRFSENFETSVNKFLATASQMGMEGIMAKKADGNYFPGERTREWLKIKVNKRHEVVIGGYTRNEGSAKTFSSLLVGVYENGKLQYTGKIGTGFDAALQKEMMNKMKKLETNRNPFSIEPDVNKPSRFRPNPPKAKVTWIKPQLVCEVSYTEITDDGVMRHPSFEGMRTDKKAKEVVKEKPVAVKKAMAKDTPPKTRVSKLIKPVQDSGRKLY
jgi:bifunctional non-homologous end joining protein LigD